MLHLYNSCNVKLKVYIYSPDIPVGSADFPLITTRYWNSLFHSLNSLRLSPAKHSLNSAESWHKKHQSNSSQSHLPGENVENFCLQLGPFAHTIPIFVPPGTHYCWVEKGSVDSKLVLGLITKLK